MDHDNEKYSDLMTSPVQEKMWYKNWLFWAAIIIFIIIILVSNKGIKNDLYKYFNPKQQVVNDLVNINGLNNAGDYTDIAVSAEYDAGYEWAQFNEIEDPADCTEEFGTGDSYDGCADYVLDNLPPNLTFWAYGYNWAEENEIYDAADCEDEFGISEGADGCRAYVDEHPLDPTSYDYGYTWAEDNVIDNVADCEAEFSGTEALDGCKDYVEENISE